MSPDEADEDINHNKILRLNLKRYAKFDRKRYSKNQKPAKFKTGKFVKLIKKKGVFTKGYAENVTKEYFKIYHVDRKLSKDRYYLKDLAGDRVLGSCTTSPSSSTQDLQVLPNYWLPFICPPPPQHEIQKLQALHPCCNSIVLHFQE